MTRWTKAVVVALTLGLVGCGAGRKAQWDAPATAATAPASGETPEALAEAGEAAWAKRGDRASLEAAIAAWEKLAALRPETAGDTYARLARAYYFLADSFLRKEGEKSEGYLATFEKGVASGERALAAVSPKFKEHVLAGGKVEDGIGFVGKEGVEAMYWYAANLGKWARAKGFAAQVGNKDRIKSVMTRVLELDPHFFHAAADRYFGAYYAVAPSFAGGDMDKSKAHFEKSLELAPKYAATRVLMADAYATKKNDRALFDKLLDEVLAMPDDVLPGLEPETRVEKEKARELKAKADELF